MRNWMRSKTGILNCSEAAVQSHSFSKISKENVFKKKSPSLEKTTN